MSMGSAFYANPNDIMLGMHESHMHGNPLLAILVHYNVFFRPACMQADCCLGKLTASHRKALITQTTNKNMPKEFSLFKSI